jgi:hypothetical protein
MPLRLLSLAFPLTLSALFYGMFATPAHAYLDPGTGSMILQVLLGGIAGLALAGRFYWHKFLGLIGMRPAEARSEKAEEQVAVRSKSQAE